MTSQIIQRRKSPILRRKFLVQALIWVFPYQAGSVQGTGGKSEHIGLAISSRSSNWPIQLFTNPSTCLISKMWSLYKFCQILSGIEFIFNFVLLVFTIIKGFDKGCGYSFYYTGIMIILLGCLSTEFNGIAKKKFAGLVFSCVFRVLRLALTITCLIMTKLNFKMDQEIDLHFVSVEL